MNSKPDQKKIEEIYQSSLSEHPKLGKLPKEEIEQIIVESLFRIEKLEKMGRVNSSPITISEEEIRNIKAVWVFSGPGNYDSPVTHQKYKDLPWTKNMDKVRVDYGFELTKTIQNSRGKNNENSPYFIYNGEPSQNEKVIEVMSLMKDKVPSSRVLIIKGPIKNTADQTKIFNIPKKLEEASGEIALISHAPHLLRIMHMINRRKTLPKNLKATLFPIATTKEAADQYALMEIRGLLYYIYLSKERDAEKNPYPYTIHGK